MAFGAAFPLGVTSLRAEASPSCCRSISAKVVEQGLGAISVTASKIDNNRVANAADGDVIARLAFLGFDVFTQRK